MVVATVGTSQAALKALQDKEIDVVLLDMNLPDRHGLDVVRAMRAAGHRADVIAVTSARDLDVVRAAVSLGIVQYVLKPFVFATLRERLLAYRAYRDQLTAAAGGRHPGRGRRGLRRGAQWRRVALPKGMGEELLARVSAAAARVPTAGCRRASSARRSGVSRVTARRYAEYLCETRVAVRRSRYAGAGPSRGRVPLVALSDQAVAGCDGRSARGHVPAAPPRPSDPLKVHPKPPQDS